MCIVIIVVGRYGFESVYVMKDVNFSLSNSYQVVFNVEVLLFGGLGYRFCFVFCYFQFIIVGFNK